MNSKTPGSVGVARPFEYATTMDAADITAMRHIWRVVRRNMLDGLSNQL